jgi:putative membrane protein
VLSLVAGFVIGAFFAGRIQWLRRIFTPRAEMRDEVAQNAARVFFDQRVHHTAGAGGLLIYLSLFERGVRVLGDGAVLEKLGQAALDELCRRLVDGVKAGDAATALCEVIEDAGARLGAVLPRGAGDRNELANALVILD